MTKICPSQCLDAPMPIVGIGIDFDIILAKLSSTHSITIANTPALDNNLASSIILFLSTELLPLNLNFPLSDCGNKPT